jgi:hypothetical protein
MKTTTLLLVMTATLLAGCDAGQPPETQTVAASSSSANQPPQNAANTPALPTAEQWQRVAQLRVLFAHQSVGGNILDGIRRAADAQKIPLVLTESRSATPGPGIQHFKVGHNGNPESKLADFQAVVSGETTPPDVALLKFCYIDFTQDVNPEQLAQHYITTLDELARVHPETVFVPMTSPLTTVQDGPRAWLKKLLGKQPGGYADNARRHVFNEAVRNRYGSESRLFDIAALESGGGRTHIESNGARIEVLNPTLTYDDGHLNDAGQRLVGDALITHLAAVSRP